MSVLRRALNRGGADQPQTGLMLMFERPGRVGPVERRR